MKRVKWVAFVLSFVMFITGFTFIIGDVEADTAGDESVSYAVVKSVADFRRYIDNNYAYSNQDVIETDWSGYTDIYKVDIPSDGKLLVASLSYSGYVDCELFTNFSLTSSLGEADGISSSREEITVLDVKAGTYYYRGKRWNGADPITVSIYLGFIPSSSDGVIYSDTSVQYDRTNNVTMQAVTSKEEFVQLVNEDQCMVAQDTIETEWKGFSEVYSFSVEESGWLLMYPLAENDYIHFQLFSNTDLSSNIFSQDTMTGTTEEPYTCYLSAGTYYFRGERWNGAEPLTFTTYFGFKKDAGRFAVASNVVSEDKSSALVTFEGENGLIRVQQGEFDASYIQSDEFWKTGNRENALEGTTAKVTANGDYVARLETEDGLYVMIPFTVSGVLELPSPSPSSLPQPSAMPTPTPIPIFTIQPTPVPEGKKTVYKVTVAKKKITVKVKKTVKIKYSVTKGYKGKVTFTSSKKKIATVSSKGVVKGKKKGTCKITLKLSNGKKAVVTVKVKK